MSKSITLTHGVLTLGQTLPRAVLHQRSLRPHRYHCPTVERPQWRGCQAEMVRDHVPVGLAAVQLLWAFTPIQRPREMFHANPGGGGTKSGKRNCIKNLSRNSSVCFTHWNRLKFNLHSKLTNIWWTAFALKFYSANAAQTDWAFSDICQILVPWCNLALVRSWSKPSTLNNNGN